MDKPRIPLTFHPQPLLNEVEGEDFGCLAWLGARTSLCEGAGAREVHRAEPPLPEVWGGPMDVPTGWSPLSPCIDPPPSPLTVLTLQSCTEPPAI